MMTSKNITNSDCEHLHNDPNKSYFMGVKTQNPIELTIGQQLDKIAQQYPKHLGLVVKHQNIYWSYNEYYQRIIDFSAGLLAIGIKPGDRVAIWATNSMEWCVGQFATAKIGAIMVCINPAYGLHELSYALKKVGCKALITAKSFKSSNYLEMLQKLLPELENNEPGNIQSKKLPLLTSIIRMGDERTQGMFNFTDIVAKSSPNLLVQVSEIGATLSPYEPINIQFTSGTTGEPKGATLTHHSILNNGFQVGEQMRLTPDDRLCIPVPLYHCFGMVMGNLACLTHASTAVFPSEAFEPGACLEAVSQYKCTALHGVPTMFIALLNEEHFADYDLSSLRTGIMAGSLCPIEVIKEVMKKMHMQQILIAYGQTETSPVNHMTDVDDSIEMRVTSVGRVGPNLEMKLINTVGEICDIGEQGEICIRGYSVMHGYWNEPEKTAETIKSDGWLHSGDLGQLDSAGYLRITGRIKDMIIRGGENIYPREIEEFLYTHPAIIEVQVFGVYDEKYGEKVCAWVQAKPEVEITFKDIRDFCKGNISHFKIPEYIEFVNEFPMTVTGKMQKFEMQKVMEKRLLADA